MSEHTDPPAPPGPPPGWYPDPDRPGWSRWWDGAMWQDLQQRAVPATAYDPTLKSRTVAGVLGMVLGGFGVHRFYLGYTGIGVAQIVVTVVTCGIGAIWGFIEGILILVGSGSLTTDAAGRPLRD